MNMLKQVVGIDVSMKTLAVALGCIDQQQQQSIIASTTVPNTPDGFVTLFSWIDEHRLPDVVLWVVMEATGVYYQRLAIAAHEHGLCVDVVLPNKIKHFALSLNQKSKTDAVDARTITRYGLERTLRRWTPPDPLLAELKALVREHHHITEMKTEILNRLHAYKHAADAPKSIIRRLRAQRDLFNKQLDAIDKELAKLVASNAEIAESVAVIGSIKGIGALTATGVVAETNHFELIANAKQIVGFSGLDPQLRESGQFKGKTPISKKGSSYLRRLLYMPTLSVIRHDKRLSQYYQQMLGRKPAKKVAIVAVMRKLLTLIYTLWKKRERYDPEYYLRARPSLG